MSSYEYVVADVFTNKPLEGNPVAVFLNASGLEADDMQRIAKELNLSETTFIFPPKQGGDYHVRIFTPVNELPFAGHPTLGTAHVLGEIVTKNNKLIFETAMGNIPFNLSRQLNGQVIAVQMEQPIPNYGKYSYASTVLEALGLEKSILPLEIYCNGPRHVYVGVSDINTLSAIKPDLRILATLSDVAINCFARDQYHWRMRMFSPAYGVAEDAATGSAAGPLALHLGRYGLIEFGEKIEIWQGVEMGKLSIMHAQVMGTAAKIESINVSGSAIIVARGELLRYKN